MRLASRLGVGLVLLLPSGLVPSCAQAQNVTAASAQAVQDQLHAWLAGLLGPAVNPSLLSPAVAPDGDHYRLTLPIPGLVGDDTASAQLRPLDGGRWKLDAIQVPASMQFNVHLPDPKGGPGESDAFSLTLGSQRSHALIDPALKTRSEMDMDLHDLMLRSDGRHEHQEQRIAAYRVSAGLQPDQGGALDFDETATMSGWSSVSRIEGKPTVTFGADRLSANGRIVGLDRDQAGILLSAASGLLATLPPRAAARGPAVQLSPEERTALHQLLQGMRGIFTSLSGTESIDGLHLSIAGMGQATINHIRFEVGGNAPNGLLHTWLDVSLRGLSLPELPSQAAGLVPQHIELRPALSGVPADALLKLALRATEPNADLPRIQAEALSLLTAHGVAFGIEKLGFDVGPADVQGNGAMSVSGPMEYHAEAHLTATGLDALIDRAHDDPMLQQAIPVLIMLRGLAKPEGQRLAWTIQANDGALTVNGLELVKPQGPHGRHEQAGPHAPNGPHEPNGLQGFGGMHQPPSR